MAIGSEALTDVVEGDSIAIVVFIIAITSLSMSILLLYMWYLASINVVTAKDLPFPSLNKSWTKQQQLGGMSVRPDLPESNQVEERNGHHENNTELQDRSKWSLDFLFNSDKTLPTISRRCTGATLSATTARALFSSALRRPNLSIEQPMQQQLEEQNPPPLPCTEVQSSKVPVTITFFQKQRKLAFYSTGKFYSFAENYSFQQGSFDGSKENENESKYSNYHQAQRFDYLPTISEVQSPVSKDQSPFSLQRFITHEHHELPRPKDILLPSPLGVSDSNEEHFVEIDLPEEEYYYQNESEAEERDVEDNENDDDDDARSIPLD